MRLTDRASLPLPAGSRPPCEITLRGPSTIDVRLLVRGERLPRSAAGSSPAATGSAASPERAAQAAAGMRVLGAVARGERPRRPTGLPRAAEKKRSIAAARWYGSPPCDHRRLVARRRGRRRRRSRITCASLRAGRSPWAAGGRACPWSPRGRSPPSLSRSGAPIGGAGQHRARRSPPCQSFLSTSTTAVGRSALAGGGEQRAGHAGGVGDRVAAAHADRVARGAGREAELLGAPARRAGFAPELRRSRRLAASCCRASSRRAGRSEQQRDGPGDASAAQISRGAARRRPWVTV